ncbi:hypothetical protein ED28_06645 [[Pantoea] beijingensis]|uniref:YejG-like protein n=1 Tax=[Pantoea] beijingensis TaxID=1324864 RepID=A0A443IF22_9GAMM|nr:MULTISPECIES: YejG family protein [Erwiniaceae]RWR02656.1 hypothetical protein ED28_06645 [[Pantoea] beijingensis]
MTTLHLSVVHRLPQRYRWSSGGAGEVIEPLNISSWADEDALIGLKLLSHDGETAWETMHKLKAALADIQVDCTVLEWEGEPCLFVYLNDEAATTCRLKNQGVAIAETFSPVNPF